jgi:hypothetical protein
MGKTTLLIVILAILLIAGCAPSNAQPSPESDSSQQYRAGSKIPVDDNVYVVTGKVVADINSISQTQAEGNMSGSGFGSTSGAYAYMSGSYAMWTEGKGFVRLQIDSITPGNNIVQPGQTVIVKTTDQKVMALVPGDQITFKCRIQYEAIAAVRDYETFDPEKLETWELDYCRMVTPKIGD